MTEQEKYGMDQLLKYLEMQINLKSDRIRMYKKQMDSNYLYYFAWAGKDLFKAYYMIEKYKELRQVLKRRKGLKRFMSIFRRNAENVSGSWLTAQFIFIIRTRSSIWRIPIEQNVPSSSYKIITGSDSFSRRRSLPVKR